MASFEADLSEIQPSQLYVNADKLARVEATSQENGWSGIDPVPLVRLGSRVVMTDGHTRALAAVRHGLTRIPAMWDEDDLDREAYEICVDWCEEEGIRSVANLEARVVTTGQYEALWLDRCRAMHERLARERGTDS
jgi:hypothetical protein